LRPVRARDEPDEWLVSKIIPLRLQQILSEEVYVDDPAIFVHYEVADRSGLEERLELPSTAPKLVNEFLNRS
jgi:hypothetical protein